MMALSEEQKKRMEQNRQAALAKRKNTSPCNIQNKFPCQAPTLERREPGPGASWALSKQGNTPTAAPIPSKPKYGPNESSKGKLNRMLFTDSGSIHHKTVWQKKADEGRNKGANTSQFYGKSKSVVKVKFVLLDKETFRVEMQYHPGAIAVFKTIQSGRYNATARTWSFALKDHNELARSLRPLQPEVELDSLPRWILETFNSDKCKRAIKSNTNFSDEAESSVEPCLWDNLMPFQKDSIRFALTKEGRILLADDMGLGKTIQSLGIASIYKEKWPLLIVCPSSVRFAWRAAIIRWLPSVPEEDINVIVAGNDEIEEGDQVIIISYGLLSRKEKELCNCHFRVAILDESHFLKDHKSIRYKAAEAILRDNVENIVLLSGTPALSRPIELFTQISLIEPKLFKFVTDFGMRYCDGRKIDYGNGKSGLDFAGHSNMDELKTLMEERFMIRRLKSDVLAQLPAKLREMIVLDPNRVKSKTKVMQEKAQQLSQTKEKNIEHAMLLEWFHLTCEAKVNAVTDYVKDLLESDKKFLVFAHHQLMIKSLCELLEKQKVKYMKIDGKTSSIDRKTHCDNFQTCDEIRVAVLSITAASTGITLTAAQLVVFAELYWNPGVLTQAEDRAHRIGQTDSVTIQYLVALSTADDKLWPMIQKKLDVLNKAGLSKDNFSNSDSRNAKKSATENFFQGKNTSLTVDTVNALTALPTQKINQTTDSLDDIDWDEEDKKIKSEADQLDDEFLDDINWDEDFEPKAE